MSDSFAPLWTLAHQAPLSMRLPKQECWKWVTISFSRGSSPPRGKTLISCIAGEFFAPEPPGKPYSLVFTQMELKTEVHTEIYTWMFRAALFIIAKIWKQPRYSSIGEWINCGTSRPWNIIQH